jgi:hypothetical protein
MTLSNERSYYSEEDISTNPPGFLRIGQVMSYSSGTKRGVCIVDYLEYDFINPHNPSPAVNDLIAVARVEEEPLRLMIAIWKVA